MAGRREFELLFKLQATLGSGFNSSINGAMNMTRQLNSELSRIHSLSGKIEGFQRQSAALQANRDKLAQLTEEHNRLQAEMSQTEQPSEALRQRMERNARQIEQTTASMEAQERRLGELGEELRNAGVDTDRLSEENDRLSETYERVRRSQENLAAIGQAQQRNAEAISKTRTQLTGTIGVITALGAAIYAGPVQKSLEFETAMAKVSTIADASIVPLSQMQKEIINLSNALGVNASVVAEDVYNAISAGQNTGDALSFVEKATKLAKGGFAETGQALDVLTTILNAYGLKSSETEKVSNMLIMTQNRGKTTVAELSAVMGKIIPTANANNVVLEQLCAGYSIMTARGIAAAETTTYMNGLLNELGKTGTKADKALKQAAGAGFKDLMAQGNSLADVLNILQGEAQKSGLSLSDMFGSAEAGKAALTLMAGGVEGFNNEVAMMQNSTGAAQAAFDAMMNTTAEKIEKAKTALSNLAIVVGNVFLPYVTTGAQKLSELVTKFSAWAQENPKLLETIVKIAAGLAAFKVGALIAKLALLDVMKMALGGISAFQQLRLGMLGIPLEAGRVRSAFYGIGMALTALRTNAAVIGILSKIGTVALKMLPIVGIAALIGGAIYMIATHLEAVRGFIQKVFGNEAVAIFDKVVTTIQGIGAAFQALFSGDISGARDIIQSTFGEAGVVAFDAIAKAIESVKAVLPVVMAQFSEMGAAIMPTLAELLSTVVSVLAEAGASILPILSQLLQAIFPILSQIVQAVLPALASVFSTLLPIIAEIISTILPILVELLGLILPIITNIVNTVLPALTQLLQFLIPIIQVVADLFGNVLRVAIDMVSGILNGLTEVLNGLITFITGVFTGNWKQAWEGVKSIFSGIWEAIKSVCTGVMNGIITAINTAIKGLNRLKIPDWVPAIGGKGINIPLIPMLAKGSNYSPETFIAGEKGAELITNARGRKVFTAAQTGQIFENMNRAQGGDTTIVSMLPLLQSMLSAVRAGGVALPPLQMAYAGATAGGVEAPRLNADVGTSLVIHSAPVFHVGSDAQAEDIKEVLRQRDEELMHKFDERMKQKADDERRRTYD